MEPTDYIYLLIIDANFRTDVFYLWKCLLELDYISCIICSWSVCNIKFQWHIGCLFYLFIFPFFCIFTLSVLWAHFVSPHHTPPPTRVGLWWFWQMGCWTNKMILHSCRWAFSFHMISFIICKNRCSVCVKPCLYLSSSQAPHPQASVPFGPLPHRW